MEIGFYLLVIFLLIAIVIAALGAVYYVQIYRPNHHVERRLSFADAEFGHYRVTDERRMNDERISNDDVLAVIPTEVDVTKESIEIVDQMHEHNDDIDDRSSTNARMHDVDATIAPSNDAIIEHSISNTEDECNIVVVDEIPDESNVQSIDRKCVSFELENDEIMDKSNKTYAIPRVKSIIINGGASNDNDRVPTKRLNRFVSIDRVKLTITPDDKRKHKTHSKVSKVRLSSADLQTDESIDDESKVKESSTDKKKKKKTNKETTTTSKLCSAQLKISKSDKEIVSTMNTDPINRLSFNDDDFKTNDDLLEFLHYHLSDNNDTTTAAAIADDTIRSSHSTNSLAHIRHCKDFSIIYSKHI